MQPYPRFPLKFRFCPCSHAIENLCFDRRCQQNLAMCMNEECEFSQSQSHPNCVPKFTLDKIIKIIYSKINLLAFLDNKILSLFCQQMTLLNYQSTQLSQHQENANSKVNKELKSLYQYVILGEFSKIEKSHIQCFLMLQQNPKQQIEYFVSKEKGVHQFIKKNMDALNQSTCEIKKYWNFKLQTIQLKHSQINHFHKESIEQKYEFLEKHSEDSNLIKNIYKQIKQKNEKNQKRSNRINAGNIQILKIKTILIQIQGRYPCIQAFSLTDLKQFYFLNKELDKIKQENTELVLAIKPQQDSINRLYKILDLHLKLQKGFKPLPIYTQTIYTQPLKMNQRFMVHNRSMNNHNLKEEQQLKLISQ